MPQCLIPGCSEHDPATKSKSNQLYVLLREGNPDCSCGDEFVGITDDIEVAKLWRKHGEAGDYHEVEVNEFWNLDGRSAFMRKVSELPK